MILDLVKAKELETRTSYITFSRNAFDELVKQTNCPDSLSERRSTGRIKENRRNRSRLSHQRIQKES